MPSARRAFAPGARSSSGGPGRRARHFGRRPDPFFPGARHLLRDRNVRRLLPVLLAGGIVFAIPLPPGGAEEKGAEGYRIFEAMAATVNGEGIFLSDVIRETCLAECGGFPGNAPVELSP